MLGEVLYDTSSGLGRFGTCLTVNSISAAKSPGKDQVCQTSTCQWLEASLLKDRKQQNQTLWAVLQPFLPPSRDPGVNGIKAFPVSPERENSSEPLLTPQFGCLSVPSHVIAFWKRLLCCAPQCNWQDALQLCSISCIPSHAFPGAAYLKNRGKHQHCFINRCCLETCWLLSWKWTSPHKLGLVFHSVSTLVC